MFKVVNNINFRQLSCIKLKYSTYRNSNLLDILKTMPKSHKHIVEVQKQRKKTKERSSKYVPGRVTLQVLGTGANGAPRSLYIFSDQSRYLFNCGEGTQRLAHEHKMKLSKLEHIFITQPAWRNIGGLPGTALTIQDVGVPQITLHGPPGLEEIFVATRRFVVIRELEIRMAECTENNKFEDNVMSVEYVPLYKSEEADSEGASGKESDGETSELKTEKRRRSRRRSRNGRKSPIHEIVDDDTDYYAHERKGRRSRQRSQSRSESGSRQRQEKLSQQAQTRLKEIKDKGVAMSYICRLQPRPGALMLDKCVQYGVPAGPLLGKLKTGEDVTLENGTVVKSVDVCEPDDPGPIFIVVDCPTVEYLDSLLINEKFQQYQWNAKEDENLATLVIHFTPREVLQHPKYYDWIKRFSLSTQHMILNESNSCMGSEAVHKIQYKLNLLSADVFPLLGDNGTEIIEESCEDTDSPALKKVKYESTRTRLILKGSRTESSFPCNVIFPSTFCSYHLRPKSGLDRTTELKLKPLEYVKETMQLKDFNTIVQELQYNIKTNAKLSKVRPYPRILFLGTGSCIPNKTRNTSGILLETSKNNHILMDCGEGTYGQIVRFFGQHKADEIVANTSAVYISHLHADHHIGLIGFLQNRRKAIDRLQLTRNPVLLFAPKQILAWLNFYDTCFESICREFELVSNVDMLMNDEKLMESTKLRVCNTLGMKNINTVFVRHCPNAFGVAFTHIDNYKITYSGDTMPSDTLIELGKNSDILIHEATMEDDLAHEAVVKMHSTTSQAIEVGNKMKAKYILLTHFSQRYAKLPRFNDNFASNVGIAFDNMQIRLDELSLVPLFYPALLTIFAEHYEELQTKAVKRQLRMDREREASRERSASLNRTKATE